MSPVVVPLRGDLSIFYSDLKLRLPTSVSLVSTLPFTGRHLLLVHKEVPQSSTTVLTRTGSLMKKECDGRDLRYVNGTVRFIHVCPCVCK